MPVSVKDFFNDSLTLILFFHNFFALRPRKGVFSLKVINNLRTC